jgi:hypothetical protein
MLRLKGSKTIAAALAGGLALMAVGGISAAQADDWHGNGWGPGGPGHGKHWNKHGRGWNDGPTVVVRNGYYYAPPPRVYYAPPPPVYYEAPPRVYYAPPPPVYVVPQPQPAISLQFRL